MPKKVRPIPNGFHSVTPSLTQADSATTIAFCKRAFGSKLLMKVNGKGGKIMHAEVLVGDSIIMLNDGLRVPPQPASLFLYVPDVDKTFAKADVVRNGGSPVQLSSCGFPHLLLGDPGSVAVRLSSEATSR